MSRTGALFAGLLSCLFIISWLPAQAQDIPLPGADPFYAPPPRLGALANGTVIRERDVTVLLDQSAIAPLQTALNISLTGLSQLVAQAEAGGFTAYQILYKSVDGAERPVAEAATLLVPSSPWTGGGTRPLISYQTAEDSISVNCEPSYVLRAGLGAQGGGSGSGSFEALLAFAALASGYAVVIPDYEGPQSEWLAGRQAAHGALDGIRASLAYARAGLSPTTPVGLWGYSGGGGATAWAAALQGVYAPELNVVGAAIGSSSNSNLATTFTNLDGGLLDGFLPMGIVGLQRASPKQNIGPYLTPAGVALLQTASDPNECLAQELATFATAGRMETYTTTPSRPLVDLPPARIILGQNSLDTQKALFPAMPVLSYHDEYDEVVPVANDDVMSEQWCASGASVEVERFATPVSGVILIHVVGAVEGELPALNYLANRFRGVPPRNDCPASPLWASGLKLPYYPGVTQ